MAEREEYNEWFSGLRGLVLGVLRDRNVTFDEAKKVLSQCLAFLQDTEKVTSLAESLKLKLTGFRRDDILELYYDIEKESREVGYISKGWADPGFRLGETIHVPIENLPAFEESANGILNMCATQGVTFAADSRGEEGLWIDLNTNIYQDGLTASTLDNVLHTLEYTANKIKQMLLS